MKAGLIAGDGAEGAQSWIERRLPVWAALAELFLDAELQTGDHERIARTIRSAGLSAPEAESVLMTEVAPAFVSNLTMVAGEWAGWRDEIVREEILAHLGSDRVRRWLARRKAFANRRLFMSDWSKIAARLRN